MGGRDGCSHSARLYIWTAWKLFERRIVRPHYRYAMGNGLSGRTVRIGINSVGSGVCRKNRNADSSHGACKSSPPPKSAIRSLFRGRISMVLYVDYAQK